MEARSRFSNPWARKLASGFTLTELLTATLIMGTVMAIATMGLINIMHANQRVEDQEERYAELNRALEFIGDDVKEADSISLTVPTKSGYSGVFQFTKSDGTTVAYFTKSKSGTIPWQGPRIIYRTENAGYARALVDAIADTAPSCSGSNPPLGGSGFQVVVEDNTKVKVCLLGYIDDATTLPMETQVFARS